MDSDPINVPSFSSSSSIPTSPYRAVANCIDFRISQLYRCHFPTRAIEFRVDSHHRWLEWSFRLYLDREVDTLYLFNDRFLLLPGHRIAVSQREGQLCWSETPSLHPREQQIIERFCLRLHHRTIVLNELLQWLCHPTEV